jgi:hypothetical protein
VIERRDPGLLEPLSDRDHTGINPTQTEIRIQRHELSDTDPVSIREALDPDIASGDRPIELGLGNGSKLAFNQPSGLGDHQRRGDQRPGSPSTTAAQAT